MNEVKTTKGNIFWPGVKKVFSFYFYLGKKAKKSRIFLLFSFLPVVMAFIFRFSSIFSERQSLSGMFLYSNMIMGIYLQFLILILSLFYGSSVSLEELEGKTLPYLFSRPVPKPAFIIGKYSAYTFLVIIMVVLSLVFSFIIMNIESLKDISIYKVLFRDMAVLCLGIICYTALFTFAGTFIKKSIFFGLLFCFGWENVIQYFPGSTQRFAIIHYLKSLLPPVSQKGFPFLLFKLEPTPVPLSVLALLLMTGVFLILGCIIFSWKEYILEE